MSSCCRLGVAGFQPKKKGTYTIEVTQEGRQVTGSPFKVEVGEGQLCHAGKVRVSGAVHNAIANKWNEALINISDAGILIDENIGIVNENKTTT